MLQVGSWYGQRVLLVDPPLPEALESLDVIHASCGRAMSSFFFSDGNEPGHVAFLPDRDWVSNVKISNRGCVLSVPVHY